MLMNRYISHCSHLHHFLNTNYGIHDSNAIICILLDMNLGKIFIRCFIYLVEDKDLTDVFGRCGCPSCTCGQCKFIYFKFILSALDI